MFSENEGQALEGGAIAFDVDGDDATREKNGKRPRRSLVAQACSFCKNRHLRCDGTHPCHQCTKRNIDCIFEGHAKRGRKSRASLEANEISLLHESELLTEIEQQRQIAQYWKTKCEEMEQIALEAQANTITSVGDTFVPISTFSLAENIDINANMNNIGFHSTQIECNDEYEESDVNTYSQDSLFIGDEYYELKNDLIDEILDTQPPTNTYSSPLSTPPSSSSLSSSSSSSAPNSPTLEEFANDVGEGELSLPLSVTDFSSEARRLTMAFESHVCPQVVCPIHPNSHILDLMYANQLDLENTKSMDVLCDAFTSSLVLAHGAKAYHELSEKADGYLKTAESIFFRLAFREGIGKKPEFMEKVADTTLLLAMYYTGLGEFNKCLMAVTVMYNMYSSNSVSFPPEIAHRIYAFMAATGGNMKDRSHWLELALNATAVTPMSKFLTILQLVSCWKQLMIFGNDIFWKLLEILENAEREFVAKPAVLAQGRLILYATRAFILLQLQLTQQAKHFALEALMCYHESPRKDLACGTAVALAVLVCTITQATHVNSIPLLEEGMMALKQFSKIFPVLDVAVHPDLIPTTKISCNINNERCFPELIS